MDSSLVHSKEVRVSSLIFKSFWERCGRESGQLPGCLKRVKLRSSLLVQRKPQRFNILCVPHLCCLHLISPACVQLTSIADLGRLLWLQISPFDLPPYTLDAPALRPFPPLHFPSLPSLHHGLHRTQRPRPRIILCHQSATLPNLPSGLTYFHVH